MSPIRAGQIGKPTRREPLQVPAPVETPAAPVEPDRSPVLPPAPEREPVPA